MYIGLDLGTSAMKALLVDDEERLVASATIPVATNHLQQGWAEQHPLVWIEAAKRALAKIRQAAPGDYSKARAIGLSGQMHSLVVLDRTKAAIRPAILWNDVRGDEWCRKVVADHPDVPAITGVRPMPSFTAAKLAWLRENEAKAFSEIAHILLPKDFVRLWLTGELATDTCDAGGTQLFHQEKRRWSRDVCSILGIDEAVLAPVLDGSEIAGHLRPAVAAELGLDKIAVICGGGDAATSSLGAGCAAAGRSMLSLGTGAVYLTMQDRFRPASSDSVHNFAHSLPGRWYHMAALLNCGSALEWICAVTGGQAPAEALGELERQAAAPSPGPSPVMFLPYLDGNRTPHCDAGVRGGFFGLERATSKTDLVQAVIEGITFALADADQVLLDSGNTIGAPILIGGGAKSLYWTRLIATVFQRPLKRVVAAETGSALGATRLAMIGLNKADPDAVATEPPTETVEPDSRLVAAYQDRLAVFRQMYSSADLYARAGGGAR